MTKFIFITGGVVSSIGKGIVASSLGRLLTNNGFKIAMLKLDPYINMDPGTMSPYQHGEVFVTDDGAETDLDLGHYERFTDISLTRNSNVTTGAIYQRVINKERRGDYLSGTVQVIPHVTSEIKEHIRSAAGPEVDVLITEVGGTIGDIEGQPFIEAIRQFRKDVGKDHVVYVHVTWIPYIKAVGELKTKPTQHSVMELRKHGIQPDILVCRTESPLEDLSIREKLSLFCDIDLDAVVACPDVKYIYEVPFMLEREGLARQVMNRLHLLPSRPENNWEGWQEWVSRLRHPHRQISVAIVGKYVALPDAYLSVIEALRHAGATREAAVDIKWVSAEEIEKRGAEALLSDVEGIIVPGGFGIRGVEGKIMAIRYAREQQKPFLGLCLGMQCAVIEFARQVCQLEDAHSTEFVANTPHPVIDFMADQRDVTEMGGTMRLGSYPCKVQPHSQLQRLYQADLIHERHRHRYEVNNHYRELLEQQGMVFGGTSPDGHLVEAIEIPSHPFFLATQFHPEFKSRPNRPSPCFQGFTDACLHQTKHQNIE